MIARTILSKPGGWMPSGPRWRVVHVSEAGATAPLLTGSSGDTQSVALVRSSGGGEDPGAGVWEPVIEFPQVAALDCAAQTQFASACAPLWPQVALELGVVDSSDSSDATSGSELVSGPRGCALPTPALARALRARPDRPATIEREAMMLALRSRPTIAARA